MLIKKIPDIIKETARNLRKNQTESERLLWNKIRYDKLWVRFLRQKPVYVYTEDSWLDRFVIPDFYCDKNKVIIEVDWNIHNLENVVILDNEKEKILENLWIKVIRVKNKDILNNINMVIRIYKK